jgi:hypothetical protein
LGKPRDLFLYKRDLLLRCNPKLLLYPLLHLAYCLLQFTLYLRKIFGKTYRLQGNNKKNGGHKQKNDEEADQSGGYAANTFRFQPSGYRGQEHRKDDRERYRNKKDLAVV